jgi:hypothetical protein
MVGSRWRALRILHLALLAALAVWAVIASTLPKPKHAPVGLDVLVYVLAGVAAIELFVVIPVLRAKLMPPRERVGDGRELDLAAMLEGRLGVAFNRLSVSSIITWALCVSVGMYGLVLVILFGDLRFYPAFAVPAALAMIAWAPSRTLIEEVARAARRDG